MPLRKSWLLKRVSVLQFCALTETNRVPSELVSLVVHSELIHRSNDSDFSEVCNRFPQRTLKAAKRFIIFIFLD